MGEVRGRLGRPIEQLQKAGWALGGLTATTVKRQPPRRGGIAKVKVTFRMPTRAATE